MSAFSELSIDGGIVTADDSDWDEARQAWNLAADQRPEAVALVESADDVRAVVAFAGEQGLRTAGQGTGHGAVALESLEGTILIKTERMRGVEVDAEAGTARVEAGVLAEEIGPAAHEEGLSWLPGSSPNVGVVGYATGGGLSWLGRRYGFGCNNIRSIEVVTADGEPRRLDADNDPDLFWALRGGGGGYAIVTAMELELVPVAEVYGGALLFPGEVAAEGARAYGDWTESVSEDVTSMLRFLHLPPIPEVPEELRDRPILHVAAACISDQAEGERTIAPLREIGEPIMDTFGQIPAPALSRIAMDPEPPVPGLGHSGVLRELPDDAIDALVEAAGPESGSNLLLAEVRHLGGALGRAPDGAGALDKLDAAWTLFGVGLPMAPEMGEAIERDLDGLVSTMEPWAAEGGYFNFRERPCEVDAILPQETCARLSEVKRKWDPNGMVVSNHPLAAATG
jgi:hypothetical protein